MPAKSMLNGEFDMSQNPLEQAKQDYSRIVSIDRAGLSPHDDYVLGLRQAEARDRVRHMQTTKGTNMTDSDIRASAFDQVVKFAQRNIPALVTALTANVTPDAQRSSPGAWPYFLRAAEHIISDINPANGATPRGVMTVGQGPVTPLAQTWMTDALRALQYATLIEWDEASGMPGIPVMTTPPTAGSTGVLNGEKKELYSKAFSIDPSAGTLINANLYLNVSNLIEEAGMIGLTDALMASAVAYEANRQILAAMTTGATGGGATLTTAFTAFNGTRFVPNVVVIPPSQIMNVNAQSLAAMGIGVVIDPSATVALVADRNATVGWFKRGTMRAVEPSRDGVQVAHVIYGKVGVQPGSVVSTTNVVA